jgi:hypothetical protein
VRDEAVIVLPALSFFVIIAAINWRLFTIPLIEYGDAAVNAIQVQNARHMHELLGNYSRWHFHHPGPFFFYIFAAGESIFYGVLHVVPAPLNGEYLAEIAISTAFLFLAIHVFYVNTRESLFPALAMLSSILFLYAVETALPFSAMVSLWPPDMALFCFLLLAVSCASFAAGNWKHAPLVAFAGMIMVHSHVAQLLFVTALTFAAVCGATIRDLKRRYLREALRAHRYHLATAFGIVIVFLLPIAIDTTIHHPNNIDHIRAYLREHHGAHNSRLTTLLYAASFFTYDVNPETVLASPTVHVRDLVNTKPFVRVYWGIFLLISVFAIGSHVVRRRKLSLFLKLAIGEIAFIILLFLYWSRRITGPMFTFNGYFFFSIQLLALFVCSSLICANVRPPLGWRKQTALASAATLPLLFVAGVKNADPGDPESLAIVSSLRETRAKNFKLIIRQPEQWPIVAGVASYLTRSGANFCVEPEWEFMFGPEHTCKKTDRYYRVLFRDNNSACELPCAVIYHRPKLYVTGFPNFSRPAIPAAGGINYPVQGPSGLNVRH